MTQSSVDTLSPCLRDKKNILEVNREKNSTPVYSANYFSLLGAKGGVVRTNCTLQKKADSLLIATLNIEERASRTIILRTCVVEGE